MGIVGGGPTGLLSANLLGAAGLSVLLVEQNSTTTAEAKAISLDDESLRIMERASLNSATKDVVLPGTGTRYYGRKGQPLFHARGPQPSHHGYPIKSPFAQPELEAALLAALDRFPNVEVRFGTRLGSFAPGSDGTRLSLAAAGGADAGATVRYLLGCDGAHSIVREQLGIAMHGSSFSQRWIVIDALEDTHDERYGLHCGDPSRPYVVIAGGEGRCRYEFLLKDGECEDGEVTESFLKDLLAPHRQIGADQVERTAVYRFHALLADHWRVGDAFLLGDAAHMMPPFAGQGLNSGFRDAGCLSWKIAMAHGGRAGDRLLDSYEMERRPHTAQMIELSVRLGEIVMATSPWKAKLRDSLVTAGMRVPPLRRYLEEMRFRPQQVYADGFVCRTGSGLDLRGRSLAQPRVLRPDGSTPLLDEVLGDGFALVAVDVPSPALTEIDRIDVWQRVLGALRLRVALDRFPVDDERWLGAADHDGGLRRALGRAKGRFLIVRPDRFVAAVFTLAEAPMVAAELLELLGRPDADRVGEVSDPPGPTTNTTEVTR